MSLKKTTPAGFEPARAEHNGLAGRRLNHSAKVSNTLKLDSSLSRNKIFENKLFQTNFFR